ncbi:hypothetical protein CSUI_001351 [Cystoisospora suis]|uniref:Uncharacterized protein n=1 Tax=Cystoisospora suis TaxID=483139 RepID=A0A2C6LCW0_9APIC|nr:hypothetical protein CSUI_001351 [Cystoisospora suis]
MASSSRGVSTAAGEVLGGWGSRSRFISFMSRGICLMTGFGLSYSFTNPDQDTVYEVFPLQHQTKYAFLHLYQVEKSKEQEFENRIKDLSRFNQKQPGVISIHVYSDLRKTTAHRIRLLLLLCPLM